MFSLVEEGNEVRGTNQRMKSIVYPVNCEFRLRRFIFWAPENRALPSAGSHRMESLPWIAPITRGLYRIISYGHTKRERKGKRRINRNFPDILRALQHLKEGTTLFVYLFITFMERLPLEGSSPGDLEVSCCFLGVAEAATLYLPQLEQ